MNVKRLLTSVIGIPAVILMVALGNQYVLGALLLIISILCIYEYFSVIKKICKPIEWACYISSILILLPAIFQDDSVFKIITLSMPIIILLLFLQVILTNMKYTFKDVVYTFFGIIYIPFFITFLELIRCMENGRTLIGYILTISWSTDIFAYLIGKNFGKTKFTKISPNKTVEGIIAGVIGAIICGLLYAFIAKTFWQIEYSYIYISIISLSLSVISQIGDLVASTIKRLVNTKDYGNILPGHGGMLDRIDSLLFLTPFVYAIFLFF